MHDYEICHCIENNNNNNNKGRKRERERERETTRSHDKITVFTSSQQKSEWVSILDLNQHQTVPNVTDNFVIISVNIDSVDVCCFFRSFLALNYRHHFVGKKWKDSQVGWRMLSSDKGWRRQWSGFPFPKKSFLTERSSSFQQFADNKAHINLRWNIQSFEWQKN